METIFLCAFLINIILQGQEADTSISLSHFMYPEINGIPIILDEGGENSFFLNTHYPRILNDYSINHIIIDGALHLPQGSYFMPKLLPKGSAPDSIHNYSQIHYQKGDYGSGELGLALQIEGPDSSYFSLQGYRQSPPVYSYSTYSSLNDNLQNYLMIYEHQSEDASISVDVMYHLEDYHLPLDSDLDSEYERETESFHGGLNFNNKWGNLWLDFHPAFQLTHTNRQGSPANYLSLWNHLTSKLYFGNYFNVYLHQQTKMMTVEKDNILSDIETHIVSPKLQYKSDRIMLEGGASFSRRLFEPEGKASWRYKNLYVSASRESHIYFEPIKIGEFKQKEYTLYSVNTGYKSKTHKMILDIFLIEHSDNEYPGIRSEIEMDIPWLRLSQKAGIYNIDSDHDGPIDMFNHMSLLFSPNVWRWRTARYQPFLGLESIYMQHSGRAEINPTKVPVLDIPVIGSYDSHLLNIELGFLVNSFKVSYLWINLLGKTVQNSSITYPIRPFRQLVVVWQFWN